jgi:hypothetical protein
VGLGITSHPKDVTKAAFRTIGLSNKTPKAAVIEFSELFPHLPVSRTYQRILVKMRKSNGAAFVIL